MLIKNKIVNLFKNRKGFTFVELLIYMGMISVMLLVLTQIFTSVLEARLDSEASSSVQQDGNYILSRFYYDITRADNINTPILPGDISTSLSLVIDGTTYVYFLNNGKLTLDDGIEAASLNSVDTTISDLSFLRLGSTGGTNSITISFVLTSNVIEASGQETRDYQTTATTR